jgi:hypothetical protein
MAYPPCSFSLRGHALSHSSTDLAPRHGRSLHFADHKSLDQLEAMVEEPARTRFLRLRTVILALHGRIAQALEAGRRTVPRWVAHHNAERVAGLDDRPGRGRPCRVTGLPHGPFPPQVRAEIASK